MLTKMVGRFSVFLKRDQIAPNTTLSQAGTSVFVANTRTTKKLNKIEENKMNFGQAIEAAKLGKKIARKGWNGKNQWVVLMPALNLPPFSCQKPGAKVNDRTAKHIGPDTPLDSQPYFSMWSAQGKWQPGWTATQSDMLAEDWEIVE